MSIYDGNMPYTNLHELNLDWVMKNVKEIKDKTDGIDNSVAEANEAAQNAQQFYENMVADWPLIWNGNSYTVNNIENNVGSLTNEALQNYDTVIIPNGTYYLDEEITIPERKTLIVLGDLVYNGTSSAIILNNCKFSKLYVNKITALNGTCIKVSSFSELNEFNEIHSMYLYGKNCIDITSGGTGTTGVQHINIYSSFIRAVEKCINITSSGAGYCGEIKFYGGELNGSTSYGIYTNGYITALRCFGLGFEALATIMELNGNNNEITLYGCRNESAGNFILKGTVKCFVFDGDYTWINKIIYNELTLAEGIVFRGVIYAEGGNYAGSEYHISPSMIGYPVGRQRSNREYFYINNTNGGEIGGALTGNTLPSIARIVSTGTFSLSESYNISGKQELIIYAEKSGITVTDHDGTHILFTTTEAQTIWRVTPASTNGYFSPSGFVVEKLTPYIQS